MGFATKTAEWTVVGMMSASGYTYILSVEVSVFTFIFISFCCLCCIYVCYCSSTADVHDIARCLG